MAMPTLSILDDAQRENVLHTLIVSIEASSITQQQQQPPGSWGESPVACSNMVSRPSSCRTFAMVGVRSLGTNRIFRTMCAYEVLLIVVFTT